MVGSDWCSIGFWQLCVTFYKQRIVASWSCLLCCEPSCLLCSYEQKLRNWKESSRQHLVANWKPLLLDFSYKENAMAVSRAFRDRPMSPLNTAIFWTEYVIRHRGAPHMRSAALELSWYQYLLLDVIAVLFVITAASLLTLYVIFKRLLHLLMSRPLHSIGENKKIN